jgi:hypothetical protein
MPGSVALVHDYLTQRGGAQRVVLALTRAFPDAQQVGDGVCLEVPEPPSRQRREVEIFGPQRRHSAAGYA